MHLIPVCLKKNAFTESIMSRTSIAASVSSTAAILALALASLPAIAQTPTRVSGAVTAVAPGSLTVKADNNGELKISVPDGIRLQRVAPGAKDLSAATAIQFSDIAAGDRVLVRITPDSTPAALTAASLIDISAADIAKKQQQDRIDWVRRGIGGLVKSVDPATGVILVTSGAGANEKTITVRTASSTILRRYASDSIDFSRAQPGPLDAIKPGDQLRARGTKNTDGSELAAEEVVSGSFRNISGSIASINTQAQTITLKDLITKQQVTVHITGDAQMRKLPDAMARALAASTKATGTATNTQPGGMAASNPGMGRPGGAMGAGGMGAPGGQSAGNWGGAQGGSGGWNGGQGSGSGAQAGQWGGQRPGGGDAQSMIARAPAIKLADLQKGDAILLVSTQGTSEVTAITLLAGVEPLLQAPASTQSMLLSGWNMSSGGAEAGAQ
jgi:Domain of unknown function (DUF5666)